MHVAVLLGALHHLEEALCLVNAGDVGQQVLQQVHAKGCYTCISVLVADGVAADAPEPSTASRLGRRADGSISCTTRARLMMNLSSRDDDHGVEVGESVDEGGVLAELLVESV